MNFFCCLNFKINKLSKKKLLINFKAINQQPNKVKSNRNGKTLNSAVNSSSSTSITNVYHTTNTVNEDEETYCTCEQISYGQMICCDNKSCKIEWFHFNCVKLNTKPKGKWYCPTCTEKRARK